MSGGFQTSVSNAPARAVAGDFCDANPRATVDAGPGGLVAGPSGAIVGRFCWAKPPADGDGFPSQVYNTGVGPVTGFLARNQQGLITEWLADASMVVPSGYQLALFNAGGFWMKNDGAVQAKPGDTVYATLAEGKAVPAAGTAASATGSIAAGTLSVTGSIANDILTVTAVGSGTVVPGVLLSGTGVASGTRVARQLSGTTGGVGTYAVSIPEQNVDAGTTITGTYGIFTAASALSGTFSIGSILSGSGVTADTTITGFGTGIGGLGTYYVDLTQTAGSTTISGTTTVATKWKFQSFALPGELAKASSWANG